MSAVPPDVVVRGGALASPGFRWFIAAIVFHSLGFWVTEVGQRWLVQELTASPFYVGLVGFAGNLPIFLFSMPGGVLADRVDRVRLIAISRGFGCTLTLVLAVLAVTGLAQVWYVALYAFLMGSMFSIEVPSRQALFPNLVPRQHIMHAVAINSAIWSGSTVVGPAVAGALISGIGTPGCFIAAVGLQAVAIYSFLRLHRYQAARTHEEDRESPWTALRSGLGYIRHHNVILGLLVLAVVTVFLGQSSGFALLPSFAADVLGGDATTFSLLVTSMGAGGLVANLGLSIWSDVPRKGRWALSMGVGLGLALLVFAAAGVLPLAMAMLFLMGAFTSGVMTMIGTLVQAHVAEGMRGRVLSAYTLCWGTGSFGSLAFGTLGTVLGVPFALAMGGALTVVAVMAVFALIPSIARLD